MVISRIRKMQNFIPVRYVSAGICHATTAKTPGALFSGPRN